MLRVNEMVRLEHRGAHGCKFLFPPLPGLSKVVNLGFGLNNEPKYILAWVNKGRGRFGSPWTIWVCADVEDRQGKEIRKEFGEFK